MSFKFTPIFRLKAADDIWFTFIFNVPNNTKNVDNFGSVDDQKHFVLSKLSVTGLLLLIKNQVMTLFFTFDFYAPI